MESEIMKTPRMEALYIIVNAGYADDIIDIARETGVKGATILHARGKSGPQQMFMGINVDPEKEMIICIVNEDTANKAMEVIKDRAGIHTPAHSICFTISIDRIIGGRWLTYYMKGNNEFENACGIPDSEVSDESADKKKAEEKKKESK